MKKLLIFRTFVENSTKLLNMAKELELKYGCNPNQKPARIFMQEGELPIEVLNGRLDTLTSWMRLTDGSW